MENDIKETPVESVTITDNEATETENDVLATEAAQVEALANQVTELNDKYLRLAAELENTRRRSVLDSENAARNRAMSVASNFLPVMDAIEAALKLTPDDEGIIAMARAMESAFAKIGIVRIESIGQPLNPQFHNAIQVVDVPQSDEPCAVKTVPNTIVGEAQSGYMFGYSVLRPAMVIVSK